MWEPRRPIGARPPNWATSFCLDIPQTGDMPKGKALDLMQASPIMGFDCTIIGTNDYADTAGSDVVVITAGIPRKPGMSRDDLLSTNAKIVGTVAAEVKATQSRRGDHRGQQSAGRDGAAGLASERFSAVPGVGPGRRAGYGPLSHVSGDGIGRERRGYFGAVDGRATATRWCRCPVARRVGGIPISRLISAEKLERDRRTHAIGGAEIVNLLKTGSAYYAPAAATAQMVEAIIRDKKRLIPCAAYCDKEYGVGGYYVGVPVVLGAKGVERVIQLELTAQEQADFTKSVQAVKELVAAMARLT